MKIWYASRKKSRVISSLEECLKDLPVKLVHFYRDFEKINSSIIEDIVSSKTLAAFLKLRAPVVACDTGFYIHSLRGFPRAYVSFVIEETIGIEGILKLVEGKRRDCEFRECLGFMDRYSKGTFIFVSKVTGTLSNRPRGELKRHNWSELSRIFIPDGYDKTLAEMSFEEHRQWENSLPDDKNIGKMFARWLRSSRLTEKEIERMRRENIK